MVSASICLRYILCSSYICIYGCSGWLHTLVNLEIISIVCKGSNGYASKICGKLRSSVFVKCQGSEFTRACNCRTVLLQVVGILQGKGNNISLGSVKSNSVKSHNSGCLSYRCGTVCKTKRICLIGSTLRCIPGKIQGICIPALLQLHILLGSRLFCICLLFFLYIF